jgi:hypothetical protein
LIYEITGLGYIDSIGTIGIIYFSVKERREVTPIHHSSAGKHENQEDLWF